MIRTSVPVPFGGFCMTQKEIRKNNPVHKLIKLDKEDRYLLKEHSWRLDSHGYPVCRYKNKYVRIHGLILPKKEGFMVDHINRNILDNRRCNLRYVTRQQNVMNSSMRKDNTSGYKGIFWFKRNKKWQASIGFQKKSIHLGFFLTKEEAASAYQKKAKELFGAYIGEIKICQKKFL